MTHKILIVDDNKEYIQTAMKYIIEESVPYALLCANNGKTGVEIALNELPDIIIMDWEMPEMDGITAIKQLKKHDTTKYIPVILSTGIRISTTDLKTAFDAGASDFIRKPLEKTEFVARVSSHLQMSDYIKTIKKQQETITQNTIDNLNEKIETLTSKSESDFASISFFNNVLNSLLIKLNKIKKCESDELEDQIDSVLCQVKQSIKSISLHVNNQNSPNETFIKSVLNRHKNLTPQEIQLCYMLKNKLSTKDIASITFREESSVKVSRSRLRKKLKLNETENLTTYLKQF